jgi:CubicO group peptidase (beta-lactamase class C family)
MTRSQSAPSERRPSFVRRMVATAMLTALAANSSQAQGGPAPLAQADLVEKIRTTAASLARRDQFSGVILLAHRGEPVFEEAFGYADREARRAVTVGTSFNVASIGKLFTQVAIAQLAAAGKLSLDSTIATYWPDYPDRSAARKVTIRQLLTHRSGIDGDIFQNPLTLRSNRDNLPAATRNPLAFEPGTRQQYSNAGYVVLGEIVERVSGEVYHEYIKRHVFAPAGMTLSGFPAIDSLPGHAAHGYTRGIDPDAPPPAVQPPLMRNAPMQPRRGSAAGGSYASVRDLLRFVLARRNGSLGMPGRRSAEMAAGGSPGTNGIVAEGLPGDYDLIVLSNFDPPAATAIADSVEQWLGAGRPRNGPGVVRAGGPQRVLRSPGQPGDEPPALGGPMQRALPETPQGRTAGEYLRAFSSGDTAVMRRFIVAHMVPDSRSVDDRLRRYEEVFSDMGALTLVGVRVAPDASLALQVNSAKNGELTLIMQFGPGTPDRIAGVQFRLER